MNERTAVTTVFLEILEAPTWPGRPFPRPTEIVLEERMDAEHYRELYDDVGAPWLWYERNQLPTSELQALIDDPSVLIYTLRVDGACAGYVEYKKVSATETQILYFGLRPDFIGRGLGAAFLDWSVRRSFDDGIDRLWLHTCTLDHPRALETYLAAGFREYKRESGWVSIPSSAFARRQSPAE